MEPLIKTYAQLAESFKSMTPRSRNVAALVSVVAVTSFAFLLNHQISSSERYLLGGEQFSTSQLRDIQTALGKAGLEAHVDGERIKVPSGQESKYMAALAESGALADFGGYLQKAVNANSFMLYGPQQEARTKVAIQSELQLVISRMKGIENAFVHIDQETKRGFREKNVVTASVAVQPRGNRSLDEGTVTAIRSFVASAWAGLKPEAVTVVDLSGPRLFAGTGGESQSPGAIGSYADTKKRLEFDWQEKISRLLVQIVPGALVATNVEFEPEISDSGKLSQVPVDAARAESKGAAAENRAVKRVTVSVGVPNTHYLQIWRKEMAPAPGRSEAIPSALALAEIEAAEKKKIEAAIFPLLGNKTAVDSSSQVAITTFFPISSTTVAEASLRQRAQDWLVGNWSNVGLAALILVGLVMLRSMVKSVPSGSSLAPPQSGDAALTAPHHAPHLASSPASESGAIDETFRPNGRQPARGRGAGASLRDELAEIVRENPDSAVSLLRTWIGNASR
jgi:flagellar M-ring protein FliF